MTNEQLAEFIKAGGAEDLKPALYDRVKHLLYSIVAQIYNARPERFNACGVELSDLRSECYFVFLRALEAYKPASGYKFTSYLKFPAMNVANELLGQSHNSKRNNKPLDNCLSFNTPIDACEDDVVIGDIIADISALDAYEDVIERIEDEQTKQVLKTAINRLPELQQKVILLHYFENITQKSIAKQLNISSERVRQIKATALRALRRMPDVRILREEQRIERRLHFESRETFSRASFEAQKQIALILKRGQYLSYGKRQAIIYECIEQAFNTDIY